MILLHVGMTTNQVSDLMGGRAGPVPMDIANEAATLRTAGWSPDQIADVLGDKLQRRFNLMHAGVAIPRQPQSGAPAPGLPPPPP